ncbi:alkaline phosphatase family protein [Candidatus Gottesmanbacteria bacterium]|nr:alkaline phosphatase family protein [Candidatus Gottesmanbacteria bacterium]
MSTKKILLILLALLAITGTYYYFGKNKQSSTISKNPVKLYWFIPDGMRADPGLFTVFQWAKEGKLPNIKKLIEHGSYGYSFPNFPSHTPTNFATLLTGALPDIHGVNDGPMREIGKPLDKVAVAGFRSVAKKVSPIWKTLEEAGMKVELISIPGSTPPEIQKGVVLRGRWGGWGADFAAINFETKGNLEQRIKQGRATRLFYFGPQLTQYTDTTNPTGWSNAPTSFSTPREITMEGWGTNVYGLLLDTTDDKTVNYDTVAISLDKQNILATVKQGDWSSWLPVTLKWKTETQSVDVPTEMKLAVIKLGSGDFFRIRIFYNNLNKYIAFPEDAASQLLALTGPMVDFVDNFPPQLVYYPEDKKIFMDEANMSLEWHKKAVGASVKQFAPDVVIHDIYTPNQMLTSRWWMGSVDPKGSKYTSVSMGEREKLWSEVQDMYIKLDTIIGEIINNTDKNTYIVLSSDHGAVPLNKSVNLNNLFAKQGWLSFTIDPKTGEPIIDWKKTKVIYLKMAHVYINPNGLDGNYARASGPEYEALREQVVTVLRKLQDTDGSKPVVEIVRWEKAKEFMNLDPNRIGDLVIANAPGYGWNEEMSNKLDIFSEPLISGYKQAIKSEGEPGMWTPFIIAGPGIKQNNFLGEKPFSLIHQYPTIMKALGINSPSFVQGKPLDVFK